MGAAGFRMLVVAMRMDEVPGLALLAELIRPDFLSAVGAPRLALSILLWYHLNNDVHCFL